MNPQRIEIQEIINECRSLMRQKKFLAAEKTLQFKIPKLGNPANLKNLLGVVYHLQSRFPEAIAQFREAWELNEFFIEPVLNLAVTFCDLGRYEQAQELYKKAEGILKGNSASGGQLSDSGKLANRHVDLGHAYCMGRDFYKGIGEYRRALAIYNSLPDVRIALAGAYTSINEYQLARKELELLVDDFPDYVKGHIELGILYYQLNKKHLAKNSWTKASSLDPENTLSKAYRELSETWSIEATFKDTRTPVLMGP